MKRNSRAKKRSTSRKRNSSKSREHSDEETLVNILNLRAESDRSLNEPFEDLKSCKKTLKEVQARANLTAKDMAKIQHENSQLEIANQRLKDEIYDLKSRLQDDDLKIKELSHLNSSLHKQIQDEKNGTLKEQQNLLNKLKSSLNDIENVLSHRSVAGKKHLNSLSKVLSKHSRMLFDYDFPHLTKNKFNNNIKEMNACIESVAKVITQDSVDGILEPSISQSLGLRSRNSITEKKFEQEIKEKNDTIEEYRLALEKLREQTLLLREKLKNHTHNENLKPVVEEKESKIRILMSENNNLNEHIRVLQSSMNEQSNLIENLKEVIKSLTQPKEISLPGFVRKQPDEDEVIRIMTKSPKSFSKSPRVSSKSNSFINSPIFNKKLSIDSQEDPEQQDLQDEISLLDQEILQLQSSLQRALGQ